MQDKAVVFCGGAGRFRYGSAGRRGQPAEGNLFHAAIPREGAEIVTLTAPELMKGAVYVYARSPCTAGSLKVRGRTLIQQADGNHR